MSMSRLLPGLLCFVPSLALAEVTTINAGFVSVIPPLLAIALALKFRQVIPALFIGLWFGSWVLAGIDFSGLWVGLLNTVQIHMLEAVRDPDRLAIVIFSLMIGGMVGIVSRNGGMQGVVQLIVTWARTVRRASVATATMGLAVFFDDYANTLVVGNTMRPVTDKLKISREKLAYIVDSTAAPVASLALVTTWIGTEVSLIDTALKQIGAIDANAYAVFLNSILYSFYPILAILFVYFVALSKRDFGPMLKAEQRARAGQPVGYSDPDRQAEHSQLHDIIEPLPDKPQRARNAVIPVLVLVVSLIAGLLITGGGEGKTLQEIIGDADSYQALIWASLLAVLAAAGMSLSQRVLTLEQTVNAWFRGMRSMLLAIVILALAWALADVTDALGTADYLVATLGDAIHPGLLPTLVFVLAAATAFSTGSSWSTMAILMPLVVPLTWSILGDGDVLMSEQAPILYAAVASVLTGSVWGDHCSPISDTTILSSMASGCDHIEHVRTQLPYALLVGLVAIGVGLLPASFGMPWWLGLLLSAALLFAILRIAGQPSS